MSLLRRLSWLLILRGLVAIVFGILALVWPGLTVLALALLFGIYAIVDGVGMLITAARGEAATGAAMGAATTGAATTRAGDGVRRLLYVLGGLVGIAAGLLTVVWPGITALVLVVFIAAWAVVTGVFEIAAAVRLRRELTGEWVLALVGVVSVLAGLLILARPGAGAIALAQVLGVYAIIAGLLLGWTGWRLYRRSASQAG